MQIIRRGPNRRPYYPQILTIWIPHLPQPSVGTWDRRPGIRTRYPGPWHDGRRNHRHLHGSGAAPVVVWPRSLGQSWLAAMRPGRWSPGRPEMRRHCDWQFHLPALGHGRVLVPLVPQCPVQATFREEKRKERVDLPRDCPGTPPYSDCWRARVCDATHAAAPTGRSAVTGSRPDHCQTGSQVVLCVSVHMSQDDVGVSGAMACHVRLLLLRMRAGTGKTSGQ